MIFGGHVDADSAILGILVQIELFSLFMLFQGAVFTKLGLLVHVYENRRTHW